MIAGLMNFSLSPRSLSNTPKMHASFRFCTVDADLFADSAVSLDDYGLVEDLDDRER